MGYASDIILRYDNGCLSLLCFVLFRLLKTKSKKTETRKP